MCYVALILTINRSSSHDLRIFPWHALGFNSAVVQFQIVKTIRKNSEMIVPKSRVALETWLAELRRTTALSDLGAVFLSLQISELETDALPCASKCGKRQNPKQIITRKSAPCVRPRNATTRSVCATRLVFAGQLEFWPGFEPKHSQTGVCFAFSEIFGSNRSYEAQG